MWTPWAKAAQQSGLQLCFFCFSFRTEQVPSLHPSLDAVVIPLRTLGRTCVHVARALLGPSNRLLKISFISDSDPVGFEKDLVDNRAVERHRRTGFSDRGPFRVGPRPTERTEEHKRPPFVALCSGPPRLLPDFGTVLGNQTEIPGFSHGCTGRVAPGARRKRTIWT